MCGRSAMIRNNERIKGGLVREEARCVDMSTYCVEELGWILSFQMNRHWRSFVFSSCVADYMNVGFPGVVGLYLLKSPRNGIRYSWLSRSGMFSAMMIPPYIMSQTLPSTLKSSSPSRLNLSGDHFSRCLDSHLWCPLSCSQSLQLPFVAPEVTGRDLYHMTCIANVRGEPPSKRP